jgi:sulfofructose kinase
MVLRNLSSYNADMRIPFVICVGGSATVDQIFVVDEVPAPSAKIQASQFIVTGGGMGANAAVAVQRVGDDELGDNVISMMHAEGIDVSQLKKLPGYRTKIASILIDKQGERLVVSAQPQGYPPDASWLPISSVKEADAVLADTRWTQGAIKLFDEAARHGIPSVLDGDAGKVEEVEAMATLATHPVFSEPMLAAIGKRRNIATVEDVLKVVFGGQNAITGVTLGGHGVVWFDGRAIHRMPSPKVQVVDTLAAGDTWHGAFALALAEHQSLEQAIHFATHAAALKCTRFGGRVGIPTRAQFENWLKTR